jgi:hypothetical protein
VSLPEGATGGGEIKKVLKNELKKRKILKQPGYM